MRKKIALIRPFTLDVSLPVHELREGMFVSNVDCGWRKTPFPLEGLLITTADEIAILNGLADYVMVDPTRSVDMALIGFLEKRYGGGKYRLGDDDALTSLTVAGGPDNAPATSEQVELEKLHRAAKRARGDASWWQLILSKLWFWHRSGANPPRSLSKRRPAYIPRHIPLASYPKAEFSWPAVPAAVTACNATLSLLSDITQGIADRSVTNFQTLERAAETMAEHIIANPAAMMWASKMLESNDTLYRRSLDAGIHLTVLGRHLGFPRELLADLALIGFLLDLGKTQLTQGLLDKIEPFTGSEEHAMQDHVGQSIAIIEKAGALPETVMRAVAEHHERIDGTGYPRGLGDSKISLYGKMAAIVDGYVAMTNPRPYAITFAPLDAIKELFEGVGTHWHGPLVEQFVQAVGVCPVGSLVELNSGHVAVVIQHTPLRRLEPQILVVTRRDKARRPVPLQVDMLRYNTRHTEARLRIVRGLPDGSYDINVRDFYFGTQ